MTAPAQYWVFRASLDRVVDGDTIDLTLDVGMHARRIERIRLLGVNAPESRGESREAGLASKAFVVQWFVDAGSDPWPLIIQTTKSDVFGRYLGAVWRVSDGASLNDDLLTSGNAVPFMV